MMVLEEFKYVNIVKNMVKERERKKLNIESIGKEQLEFG